jgi:hypothetical protein
MKVLTKSALLGAMITLVVGAQAFVCSDPSEVPHVKAQGPGFAVVELFTSEGCSSCPPADQLVARLEQEDKGEPVYILAFHVDYWDRLGWKDAFSDARYTQRQNQYAAWLKLNTIYTPQVVVNGRQEMVGSQEASLRKAINSGLLQTPADQLSLSDIREDRGKVDWKYRVAHPRQKQTLVVAVVQRRATTDVKAGENSGRTLSHVQIVRNLTSTAIAADGSGAGNLLLPAGIGARDEELIAFVQDDSNGNIVAAASASIP